MQEPAESYTKQWATKIVGACSPGEVQAGIRHVASGFNRADRRDARRIGVAKVRHIIDPRTGHPAAARPAAWARAATAARGDALSTAFMVLTVPEIQSYCRHHADAGALLTAPIRQKVPVVEG